MVNNTFKYTTIQETTKHLHMQQYFSEKIFETSVQEQIMNRPRDSFDCSTKGSIRYINLIVLYVLRYIVGFTCDYLMFLEQMDLLTVCDTPAFP